MMMKKIYAALALAGTFAVSADLSGCAEETTRSVFAELEEAYSAGTSEGGEAVSAESADG